MLVKEDAIEEAVQEAVTAKTQECDEAFEGLYDEVGQRLRVLIAKVKRTQKPQK